LFGWHLPPFEPLLTDARTGFAHQGCYAAVTNDCSSKLSNEHWLSKGILLSAGDGQPVCISGFSWQPNHEDSFSAERLGSKILCRRHNTALARLDRTALRVFNALRRYQQDLLVKPDPHGNEFFLASGEEIERWLLKMLWGATAAGVIAVNGKKVTELTGSVDRASLADYLFRDGPLPDQWGLYVEGLEGREAMAKAEVAVTAMPGPDGGLWRGVAAMGVVEFDFYLGVPPPAKESVLFSRPDGIGLGERGQSTAVTCEVQKLLVLAWDRPAGATFNLEFKGSSPVPVGPQPTVKVT